MTFKNMTGQKQIISSLEKAFLEDRVGHAYIFCGPRGIGKKTAAMIFSELLLCNSPKGGESCGECNSCLLFKNGANPDFHTVESDSANISIDEVRKIQGNVIIKPLYSRKKVYLIADADKMTVQAQNCLLKTLEEPPEYAVIILTTSNYDSLMETVRSRSLKYNFIKNSCDEIRGMLLNRFGSGLKGTDFILSYSGGIIGTALELAESEEFISLREKTVELLFGIAKSKLLDVFSTYGFFEANKDEVTTVLDIMLLVYRDILVVKKGGNENMLINSDKKDIILSNAPGFSTSKIIQNMDTIEITRKNLKGNANYQLSIEVMLIKLQEEDI